MFLIYIDKEKSLTAVANEAVICDMKTVKKDDFVSFVHNGQLYKGQVTLISDDDAEIKEALKDFKDNRYLTAIAKGRDTNRQKVLPKETRSSRKKKAMKDFVVGSSRINKSDEKSNAKKAKKREDRKAKKKQDKEIQLAKKAQIEGDPQLKMGTLDDSKESATSDEDSDEKEKPTKISSSKDDLLDLDEKEKLPKISTFKDDKEPITNDSSTRPPKKKFNVSSSEDDEDENDSEADGWQLYGKEFVEPGKDTARKSMKHLKNGIYCRRKSLALAKANAKSATSMIRQLVPGVFTKRAQIECTVSGGSVRSLGEERKKAKVETLNAAAVQAVIEFVNDFKKGEPDWVKKEVDLRRAVSAKLTEQKRYFQQNPTAEL